MFKRFFTCTILGFHKWTSKARRKEPITDFTVKGFEEYVRSSCKYCGTDFEDVLKKTEKRQETNIWQQGLVLTAITMIINVLQVLFSPIFGGYVLFAIIPMQLILIWNIFTITKLFFKKQ